MSDLFKEKAANWDANERAITLSSAIGSSIIDQIPLHGQMNVMDFGAGTGLISSHIAPLVKNIVAVDVSRAMLEQLAAKSELHGKVQAVCQDITEKPLSNRFDLIMSAMAVHHVADTSKLIKAFSQHLKPGSMIAIADLDKEDGSFHPGEAAGVFHFGFDRAAFKAILEANGFSDVRFSTVFTINKNEKKYPVFLAIAIRN